MNGSITRLAAVCALSTALWLLPAGSPPARAEELASAGKFVTQTPPEETSPKEVRDPEALAELKRATDFLTSLPRFHFEASVAYDVVQEDGRRLQFERHGEVYLQRPDHLFAETFLDDGRHRRLWYDGKTMSIAELTRKIHTQAKAPATIDGMLDMLEKLFKDPMPLADLLYSDLSPLAEHATEADIVEDSLIDGVPCTHLSFRGATVDWQLWIDQGKQPFIRKVVVTYREQPGVPQYIAWLDNWETPAKIRNGLFTFAAPKGSQWIDLMVTAPREAEEGGRP